MIETVRPATWAWFNWNNPSGSLRTQSFWIHHVSESCVQRGGFMAIVENIQENRGMLLLKSYFTVGMTHAM